MQVGPRSARRTREEVRRGDEATLSVRQALFGQARGSQAFPGHQRMVSILHHTLSFNSKRCNVESASPCGPRRVGMVLMLVTSLVLTVASGLDLTIGEF